MASGGAPTEATALTTPRPEDNVEEIGPAGSVYNAILFLPTMQRYKHGTLKTWEVFLLCIIFLTCILIQGGLTFLTGRDILTSYREWKESLVFEVGKKDLWDRMEDADVLGVGESANNMRGSKRGAEQCCTGVECFELGLTCCAPLPRNLSLDARTALVAQRHHQQHSVLVSAFENNQSSMMLNSVFGDKRKKAQKRAAALCVRDGSILNCAPHSIAYVNRWHDLDFDGDGVWTLDEAKEDSANLGCELGVATEDIFRRACGGLAKDTRETARLTGVDSLLPESIARKRAIPHIWFIWWSGIAAMCVNTDTNLCGKLMSEGLFDEAMNPKFKGLRGDVTNLDKAMEYCGRLLSSGGICDSSLPVSYDLYRARIGEKCGAAGFSRGPRHTNPYEEDDIQGTVAIEYAVHAEYAGTRARTFLIVLCFILFLWYSTLVDELKSVMRIWDFVGNFPVNDGDEHDKDVIEVDGALQIQAISRASKRLCMVMVTVRSLMFFYMSYVGTVFLLSNHSYLDLLMNSVALAFIFELDEFIYSILVSEEEQSEHEGIKPFVFMSWFPHAGHKAKFYKKANWGLFLIPAICTAMALYNDSSSTAPIVEALECACFHSGDTCADGQIFTPDWWKFYWKETAWLAGGSK